MHLALPCKRTVLTALLPVLINMQMSCGAACSQSPSRSRIRRWVIRCSHELHLSDLQVKYMMPQALVAH